MPGGGRRKGGGESRLTGEETEEELRLGEAEGRAEGSRASPEKRPKRSCAGEEAEGTRERRVGRRELLAEGRCEQQLAGEEAQEEPGRADGSCGSQGGGQRRMGDAIHARKKIGR